MTRQLQRTIPICDLPRLVTPHLDQVAIELPPLPENLPLYCHYCGRDALTFDADDKAVCATCYGASAHQCDDCGAIYIGDHCEDCQTCCEHCGEPVRREDARTNLDGDDYCDDCYCELYGSCEHCGGEVLVEDVHCHEDSCYCQSCFDEHFTTCDDCGETIANDDCACRDRSQTICNSCYEANYFTCDRCGKVCHCDNYAEDCCCSDCYTTGDIEAKAFEPQHNTYLRTGSGRCFGVELETSSCENFQQLDDEVCFSSQDDGSIGGKEFVSEVLSGDAGLSEVERFCRRADELGFTVDSSCGFHLHIDVRDLTEEQLANLAIAYNLTYNLWASFVSDSRRANGYCKPNSWDADSHLAYDRFVDFARAQDRYQWFNVRSYSKHSTFEIRLHSGTLSAEKVCNWIIAHLQFVAAVVRLSRDEVLNLLAIRSPQNLFAECREFWPEEIAEYLRQRAAKFGTALPARELATIV